MKRQLAGFRPGRSAQPVFAAAVISLVLAGMTRSAWLQVVACGLLGLLASSALGLLFDKGCEITLQHPGELVVGVPVEVRFTIENPGLRRSRPLALSYRLRSVRPLLPQVDAYIDPVPAGGRVEARATVVPVARGEATHATWSVAQLGAFGLFSIRPTRLLERRVVVAPAPARALAVRVEAGASDGGGVLRAGLDVRGVREWRPGDIARHVHWRATARTGELRVIERAEPARGALGVLFAGVAGDPRFEQTLGAVAATVWEALGGDVDCFGWLEQSGAGCFGKLTRASAMAPFTRVERAELPSAEGFYHLLEHVGAGGALLLAIADDVPPDWVRQVRDAAASSGILVVDAREFAQEAR